MVQREEYLPKLILWRDEQVIKVVTGIRRCGISGTTIPRRCSLWTA